MMSSTSELAMTSLKWITSINLTAAKYIQQMRQIKVTDLSSYNMAPSSCIAPDNVTGAQVRKIFAFYGRKLAPHDRTKLCPRSRCDGRSFASNKDKKISVRPNLPFDKFH